MLRKTTRATSQILQVLICIYNIEVNGSTIRKRLNDYGLFGRFYRRMPPLSKENILSPKRRFVLITKHMSLTSLTNCQHGGGRVMNWICFVAKGLGNFPVIELTMNSSVFQSVLESNVRPSKTQSLTEIGSTQTTGQ